MTNDIDEKNTSIADGQDVLYCNFCTKSSLHVKVLISAARGEAYICGDCVGRCAELVEHWKEMQED